MIECTDSFNIPNILKSNKNKKRKVNSNNNDFSKKIKTENNFLEETDFSKFNFIDEKTIDEEFKLFEERFVKCVELLINRYYDQYVNITQKHILFQENTNDDFEKYIERIKDEPFIFPTDENIYC